MKNNIKTLMAAFAVALLSCSVFSQQAQAVEITGGISLSGGYTTDTGNVNTANAFTGFTGVFVASAAGSYAGVPTGGGSPVVTQNAFSFNPFVGASPLWTFMFGGRTYSFNLTTLTSTIQTGNDALELRGLGTLMISGGGFDNTVGTWIFTANQAGGTFSFSSSNGAQGPEGGSALALLGLGLVAVEALRRKLVAG